jgi:hypothetical protein
MLNHALHVVQSQRQLLHYITHIQLLYSMLNHALNVVSPHRALHCVLHVVHSHTILILYALACGTLTCNTSYTKVFNRNIGFLPAQNFTVLYCMLCEYNDYNNKWSPSATCCDLYSSPSGYCRTYWEIFGCLLFLHEAVAWYVYTNPTSKWQPHQF